MADLKDGLAPRSINLVRRRLLSFRLDRGSRLDNFRLWFGLNAIKVKDLKGRISRQDQTSSHAQGQKYRAIH
ncbi:hypothetical protein [Citrobacter koseri]|uniref:hypothetical protein n=1 Tax=Citrobacter koseri TaxID=545 RepID=UPI000E1AE58D|nr:hypothetical protein [Citrobacter koseri]STA77342.1 Uncharacterised protein [Citrobacter koseri]